MRITTFLLVMFLGATVLEAQQGTSIAVYDVRDLVVAQAGESGSKSSTTVDQIVTLLRQRLNNETVRIGAADEGGGSIVAACTPDEHGVIRIVLEDLRRKRMNAMTMTLIYGEVPAAFWKERGVPKFNLPLECAAPRVASEGRISDPNGKVTFEKKDGGDVRFVYEFGRLDLFDDRIGGGDDERRCLHLEDGWITGAAVSVMSPTELVLGRHVRVITGWDHFDDIDGMPTGIDVPRIETLLDGAKIRILVTQEVQGMFRAHLEIEDSKLVRPISKSLTPAGLVHEPSSHSRRVACSVTIPLGHTFMIPCPDWDHVLVLSLNPPAKPLPIDDAGGRAK